MRAFYLIIQFQLATLLYTIIYWNLQLNLDYAFQKGLVENILAIEIVFRIRIQSNHDSRNSDELIWPAKDPFIRYWPDPFIRFLFQLLIDSVVLEYSAKIFFDSRFINFIPCSQNYLPCRIFAILIQKKWRNLIHENKYFEW